MDVKMNGEISNYYEFRLQDFHRFKPVAFGAILALGGILLFTALLDLPGHPTDPGFAWFAVWVMLELSTTTAGIYLLASGTWRCVPINARRGAIIGLLTIAWLGALEFVAWVYLGGADDSFVFHGFLVVTVLGAALAGLHRHLTRNSSPAKSQDVPV